MKRLLWLRHETKPGEKRTALTPCKAARLLSLGLDVVVEKSPGRIFPDNLYREVGCEMVEAGAWKNAPLHALILGLKEIPEGDYPLEHRHVFFGHAFKGQAKAKNLLERFVEGGGTLYDLEFIVDENKRRIAAFGEWAGYAGAALAFDHWLHKVQSLDYSLKWPLTAYPSQTELIQDLLGLSQRVDQAPKVLIIGGQGRSSRGAQRLFRQFKIEPEVWSSKDTKGKGHFIDILNYDIFVNCVLVKGPLKPFITQDMLKRQKKLKVICDVSCDPTSPHNPLPFYNQTTNLQTPSQEIEGTSVDMISIDHLPSLLPRESSEDFCEQLFPHLVDLLNNKIEQSPWEKTLEEFYKTLIKLDIDRSPRQQSLNDLPSTLLM